MNVVSQLFQTLEERKECAILPHHTVGDGSLSLPVYVVKITHPPPGVSWVSRDEELNSEHKYIGFLLYHALMLT